MVRLTIYTDYYTASYDMPADAANRVISQLSEIFATRPHFGTRLRITVSS